MNCIHNDQGGITYASPQRIGLPEHRSHTLNDVRVVVDAMQQLCTDVRQAWPERYPVPPEIDALMNFCDYAIARVRGGTLRQFAEHCDQ